MEIKNITIFFIGIAVLILGILVIIFDYPQIQYFEKMSFQNIMDEKDREMHQRLIIEISVGGIMTIAGSIMIFSSFLKRFENGIR